LDGQLLSQITMLIKFKCIPYFDLDELHDAHATNVECKRD